MSVSATTFRDMANNIVEPSQPAVDPGLILLLLVVVGIVGYLFHKKRLLWGLPAILISVTMVAATKWVIFGLDDRYNKMPVIAATLAIAAVCTALAAGLWKTVDRMQLRFAFWALALPTAGIVVLDTAAGIAGEHGVAPVKIFFLCAGLILAGVAVLQLLPPKKLQAALPALGGALALTSLSLITSYSLPMVLFYMLTSLGMIVCPAAAVAAGNRMATEKKIVAGVPLLALAILAMSLQAGYGVVRHGLSDGPREDMQREMKDAEYDNLPMMVGSSGRGAVHQLGWNLDTGGLDKHRVEDFVDYLDYGYPLPENAAEEFRPVIAVYDSPWNRGKKILQVGLQGRVLPPAPANFVFLLAFPLDKPLMDRSDFRHVKDMLFLPALEKMLEKMRPEDRVTLLMANGDRSPYSLASLRVADRVRIVQLLRDFSDKDTSQMSEGSNSIREAYAVAERSFVEGGSNRVITMIPGYFALTMQTPHGEWIETARRNAGRELQALIHKKRESGIFLTAFGVSEELCYNNSQLHWVGFHGETFCLSQAGDYERMLSGLAEHTSRPLAQDLRVTVDFNSASVRSWRLVGYVPLKFEYYWGTAVDDGDFVSKVDANKSTITLRRTANTGFQMTVFYEFTPTNNSEGDISTLALDYKNAASGAAEKLIRRITERDVATFETLSSGQLFALSVAGFSQYLSNKDKVPDLTLPQVIDTASAAKDPDPYGQRKDMIHLMNKALDLQK